MPVIKHSTYTRGREPGKHFALKRRCAPSFSETVRRGSWVKLPATPAIAWKLGQRVFFSLRSEGSFEIGPVFKRAYGGKVLSSRLRRAARTLREYGPRGLGK
jgi:hypothetical protein